MIVTLITCVAIRIFLYVKARNKRYQLFQYYGIPTPKTNITSGNLDIFLHSNITRYKVEEEFYKSFGSVFGYYIGDEPGLIVIDLEILRKIFLEKMGSFKERIALAVKSTLSHGILFAPHHKWKMMRKIMSPSFNSYATRGESVQFVEDSIKLMLNYIEEKLTQTKGDRIILDMHDLMKSTALHMISSMAIRLPNVQVRENEPHVESLDAFLSTADKGFIIQAIKYPIFLRIINLIAAHFEYDAQMATIHRELGKTIDAKLKELRSISPDQVDTKNQEKLIDFMIRLHYAGKLTRKEIIGNADAILFAGYDTTSTTLTYVFWVLGKYTDIQDKLRSDLMTYGTESGYLEQVLNETMRLYPTVITFTTRLATETVELDGLTIPQGTKVVYHTWLIQRNPKFWSEPEKFDPERFKKGVEIHPCAFAPFGLGERKCLGYQLAKLEMKMIICDILLRYRLKTVSPDDLELITYANNLTKPKEKVVVELQRL